jgi:transcriptional antiterminator RfaH
MSKQWFIGIYQPGRWVLAKRELEKQEFETYMPIYVSEWKRIPKVSPFLPGYIFIRMDSDHQRWRSILSTFGMRSILCTDSRPHPVADWIIDDIRSREVNELVQLPPPLRCKFKKGDKVQMKNSPLQMVFDEPIDARRAAAFISILGRQDIRTVVPLNKLFPATYAGVA